MRALAFAAYGPADALRIEDRPMPAIGADEVLVRVAAAGVNPADWRLRSGQFKRFMKLALPFTPGSDVAGVVAEAGAAVTGLREGDAVFAMTPIRAGGACAEYVAIPAALVAPAPRALPLRDAAALPLAGLTALQGLRDKARLEAGQSLLVTGGSGGVGHFAVQIGKAMGASVAALCGRRSLDFVRGLGADAVFDYADPRGLEAGGGYDVVFDVMATEPFTRWRGVLRAGGTVVTVNPVIGRALPGFVTRMMGVPRLRSLFVAPGREDLLALKALAEDGRLKPAIERRFALADAADAHRLSEAGHVRGKLVIDVDGGQGSRWLPE